MSCAVENILNGVRYRFLDEKGPRLDKVSSTEPLVHL